MTDVRVEGCSTSSAPQDHVLPSGLWKFDEEVTKVFDDMLARSIPGYETMRWATHQVGAQFLQGDWSTVVDIGASRGESVDWFIQNHPRHKYKLIEISQPMRETLEARYSENPDVRVWNRDLREADQVFDKVDDCSMILSVLTLMFVPIEHRPALVRAMWETLRPGGVLIMVEKMLGATPLLDAKLKDTYYKMKADNGYTQDEILRKKLSLEGVLVPLTETWNRDLLERAGFNQIDYFFRCLQFGGFIAVK